LVVYPWRTIGSLVESMEDGSASEVWTGGTCQKVIVQNARGKVIDDTHETSLIVHRLVRRLSFQDGHHLYDVGIDLSVCISCYNEGGKTSDASIGVSSRTSRLWNPTLTSTIEA
jgi:hypothetical protein